MFLTALDNSCIAYNGNYLYSLGSVFNFFYLFMCPWSALGFELFCIFFKISTFLFENVSFAISTFEKGNKKESLMYVYDYTYKMEKKFQG